MVKNKTTRQFGILGLKKYVFTFSKVGSSINIDKRLFKEDIKGSIVHVEML